MGRRFHFCTHYPIREIRLTGRLLPVFTFDGDFTLRRRCDLQRRDVPEYFLHWKPTDSGAHIRGMKNLGLKSSAFVGAGVVALGAAYLAHTVLGIPPTAIRHDSLGMAACLCAFIGAGIFAQRRDK